MKLLPIILALLLASSIQASEPTRPTTVEAEIPVPALTSKRVVTVESLEKTVENLNSLVMKFYEKQFRMEARILRIEKLLRSLSGQDHIHQWEATVPPIVKEQDGKTLISAICGCGEFRYVPVGAGK